MRKLAAILVLLIAFTPLTWAIGEKSSAPSAGVVDAGNRFCPVSGDKVSGKHFVEYQGRKYGLCCKMCAGKFKKNPEKYLTAMVNQELTGKPVESHHHMH